MRSVRTVTLGNQGSKQVVHNHCALRGHETDMEKSIFGEVLIPI
jgi:hypothetical protein